MWTLSFSQLAAALVLDLVLGDPRRMPHLAKFSGMLAGGLERILTKLLGRTVFAGVVLWFVEIGFLLAAYASILWLIPDSWVWLQWGLGVLVFYQSFAATDMQRHVQAVLRPLKAGNVESSRSALSRIVGRDTDSLDEPGISRAAIECVGESACDSMIAPFFWGAILGPAGAMIYRGTNTLDSMVGHRNERYLRFGKFSAKVDDLLNWVPARLVMLLSKIIKPNCRWQLMLREARMHPSPNAGWGEAALAYDLGVRLGGTNRYQGKLRESVILNPSGDVPTWEHLESAMRWYWRIFALGAVFLLFVSIL